MRLVLSCAVTDESTLYTLVVSGFAVVAAGDGGTSVLSFVVWSEFVFEGGGCTTKYSSGSESSRSTNSWMCMHSPG